MGWPVVFPPSLPSGLFAPLDALPKPVLSYKSVKSVEMSQTLHPRMDMDGMVMMMTPYLHFTTDSGDPLWFAAWAPVSNGAIAGACIGLVALAMFERLLNGIRGVLVQEWAVRYACCAVRF